MSVAFYMDDNVPRALVSALRIRCVDVLTVVEDGRSGIPDSDVIDRASELGRVAFSHDADFLAEARARQNSELPFSGVVYAHPLQLNIGQLVFNLELIGTAGHANEFENQVVYLPV